MRDEIKGEWVSRISLLLHLHCVHLHHDTTEEWNNSALTYPPVLLGSGRVFSSFSPQALRPTVNYSHFFFFFLNLADILNAVRRLTDRSYIIRVTETQKSNRNGMERRANVPKESNANWSWVTARGGWTHTLIFALWTAKRLLTLIWEKAQRKIRLEFIFQNKRHTRYALKIDTSCMD